MVHSHKKNKGSANLSTVSPVAQPHLYLSPQRKDTTINKRVSVQSPQHFPSKNLSLSGSLASETQSDGALTIGSDSDNRDKEVEVVDNPIRQGTCAEVCEVASTGSHFNKDVLAFLPDCPAVPTSRAVPLLLLWRWIAMTKEQAKVMEKQRLNPMEGDSGRR